MATLPAQPLPPRHSFLDTPDLDLDDPDTLPDTERTSSDTTIFTIYSMYGDIAKCKFAALSPL